MAMRTDCPRDQHGRTYDDQTKRLTCSDKTCSCADRHRPLSEPERKQWVGE